MGMHGMPDGPGWPPLEFHPRPALGSFQGPGMPCPSPRGHGPIGPMGPMGSGPLGPWEGPRPWHAPMEGGPPGPLFGPDGQEVDYGPPLPPPVPQMMGCPPQGLPMQGPGVMRPPIFLPGTMAPPGPTVQGYMPVTPRIAAPLQIVRHVQAAHEDVEVISVMSKNEAASPEWAGLDRSPMRTLGGFSDVASVDRGSVCSEVSCRQIEETASEAARALRVIAHQARVQLEQINTEEVLANQARQEQVLTQIAEELLELRTLHHQVLAQQERREPSMSNSDEWRQMEEAAAEASQALRAITVEAEARVHVEQTTSEVLAHQVQQEKALARMTKELSELKEAQRRAKAEMAQERKAEKKVIEEKSNTPKGVEMECTIAVPKQTVMEDKVPGSFLDGDVMQAVEKARAAVAEMQRHAGLLPEDGPLSTTSVASCAPFCRKTVGLNILLSHDGYTATRSCGCRESVAICKGPLSLQMKGWYFEVEVLQTVDGWLGGLGIGVTHTDPSEMKDQRLPDKASKVPRTFILGYAGFKFLNGSSDAIEWQAERLQAGQRVGLFVSRTTMDLLVLVDGQEVTRVLGHELRSKGFDCNEPLYGIVDVSNAALSVRLLPGAQAPQLTR